MAKLQKFTEDRIQKTIDLADVIIAQVNAEIEKRRKVWRKKRGTKPRSSDIVTRDLAQDVMAALAHRYPARPRSAHRQRRQLSVGLDFVARWARPVS